ncbi:DUF7673 family protein [Variovorax saccharolyticus]|uniref:DUF7673 family protein n=1 Tax=Variovorax saccharolyticus TaxID=3053516 RepID=UPI0025766A29|nr:hypothetical protein [Variovorax sp. J31P216]MDM0029809.1 hypothetical protein [Variovorax sp. J31P216]
MDRDIIETKGATALQHLFTAANRDSGDCRYIARFLLGLYNGQRFPFDLTDLRAIDGDLFEDCMTVLRMDARVFRQEVHLYCEDGGKLEQLAAEWRIEDMLKVRAPMPSVRLSAKARRRCSMAACSPPRSTPAPMHPATERCRSSPGSAKKETRRST